MLLRVCIPRSRYKTRGSFLLGAIRRAIRWYLTRTLRAWRIGDPGLNATCPMSVRGSRSMGNYKLNSADARNKCQHMTCLLS
ncbi:hypothetical protein FOFC_05378 [Fusarium oxysporum]|nr:hypothetical protein FOFC_05378 [Fusarium oxysporum]